MCARPCSSRPSRALIPPNNLYNVANINVPIDDTHTAFYFIAWGNPAHTPDTETWRKFLGQQVGVDLDAQLPAVAQRRQHLLAGPRRR